MGNSSVGNSSVGKRFLLKIPLINSAGDGLPLLVIQNRLRIELLFWERKNFAGDDLSVATC